MGPTVTLKKIFNFKVGDEIKLQLAQQKLILQNTNTFKIKKFERELVITDAPLVVNLDSWEYEIESKIHLIEVTARIWSFGVISIIMSFEVQEESFQGISKKIDQVEKSEWFYLLAKERVELLSKELEKSIVVSSLWCEAEDYLVILVDNTALNIEELKPDLYRLMEGHFPSKLSQQTKKNLVLSSYQYTENDLIIIDWNQSLIVGDPIDHDELTTILDFALCQLLALRFYDDLIDQKLSLLYKSIRNAKSHFFKNEYAALSKESAILFIEFSEVLDTVSNSFKFIGDTYYAQIYRVSMEKFRVQDWFSAVKHKLSSFSDISKMFSSEVHEKRSQFMELVIIILIFIEVIPFVMKYFPSDIFK